MATIQMYANSSGAGTGLSLSSPCSLGTISSKIQTQINASSANDVVLNVITPISLVNISLTVANNTGKRLTVQGIDSSGNPVTTLEFIGDRPSPWNISLSQGSIGLQLRLDRTDFMSTMLMRNYGDGAILFQDNHTDVQFKGGIKGQNVRSLLKVNDPAVLTGLIVNGIECTGFSKKCFWIEEGSGLSTGAVLNASRIYGLQNSLTGILDCAGQYGDPNPVGISIETGVGGASDDVVFEDITAKDCILPGNSVDYPQGDGFGVEGGPYNITFRRCHAVNCGDGGFDLKGSTVGGVGLIVEDCDAIGCMRSLRSHYSNVLVKGTFISKDKVQRYGSGNLLNDAWTDTSQFYTLDTGAAIVAVNDSTVSIADARAFLASPLALCPTDIHGKLAYLDQWMTAVQDLPANGTSIIQASAAFTATSLGEVDATGGSTTSVITTIAAVAAGNPIVIPFSARSGYITSIADTAGNTYASDIGNNVNNANYTGIWRCSGSVAAMPIGSTITVTYTASASNRYVKAFVLSKAATLEASATSRLQTAGTAAQAPGISTALTAGGILIAISQAGNTSDWVEATPSDWTADKRGVTVSSGVYHIRALHRTVDNVNGSNNPSFTPSASQTHSWCAAAYKP
jgi:hypothetical protein